MADGCDYQGYEFGAHYLDSVCIDGFLWDADSGEPGADLSNGGDIPCPQCNHDEWLAHHEEDIVEEGYNAFAQEMETDQCPYPADDKKEHKPGDFAVFRFLWLKGYAEGIADQKAERARQEQEKA